MLEPEAKEILNKIIDIQLSSYNRIMSVGIGDKNHYLFQIPKAELSLHCSRMMGIYLDLKNSSNLLGTFEDRELMTMRHILFRMEDEWCLFNRSGVTFLWEEFYKIEESRNPYIKFTLNNMML